MTYLRTHFLQYHFRCLDEKFGFSRAVVQRCMFSGVGEKVFLSVGSLKALAAKAIFRAGDHEINISHRYWGFSAGNKGRISKGYKKEIQ